MNAFVYLLLQLKQVLENVGLTDLVGELVVVDGCFDHLDDLFGPAG